MERARNAGKTTPGQRCSPRGLRLGKRLRAGPAAWALAALSLFSSAAASRAADVIAPRVLVIATYETGKDRGDTPGELQYWVEREHLDQSITVPGLDHPVLTNGRGLYAMVCGTTSRCAVQMMALAMDGRFDLRQTYFLLGGIAGIDPAAGTAGSVAWITQVVDGDPIFEIDSRETPAAWPYGTVALGATEPGQAPAHLDAAQTAGIDEESSGGVGRMVYRLNPSLVAWAYNLTRDVPLQDGPDLSAWRARFKDAPRAQHASEVQEGASLGCDRFWHGAILNRMAEDWVRMYTGGQATFVMSDCEDQGICVALEKLNQLGKLDFQRLLVLRSASNFTVPPPGVTPAKNLFDSLISSAGYLPSLDNEYRVGSVVTAALLHDWDKYRDHGP